MRELNVTQNLLHKALQQLQATPNRRAVLIHIALGEIAELDPAVMQAQWLELGRSTPVEHAQLRFRLITAEVQCMACFQKYHPVDKKIACPYCGGFGAKILTGEECYLESLETTSA